MTTYFRTCNTARPPVFAIEVNNVVYCLEIKDVLESLSRKRISFTNKKLDSDTKEDMIQFISENLEETDERGFTPLFMALENYPNLVKFLLDLGANVEARIPRLNQTPLLFSLGLFNIQPSTIQLLLDAKANPNARDSRNRNVYDIVLSDEYINNNPTKEELDIYQMFRRRANVGKHTKPKK